jgi:hypothetical protein
VNTAHSPERERKGGIERKRELEDMNKKVEEV